MRLDKKFREKLASATRESKYIDFKEMFDPDSERDWCELIKDIVAIANSGGGCILIGVRDDGTSAPLNYDLFNKLDSAKFMDKIYKYTGNKLASLEISTISRNNCEAIALLIANSNIPMVFHRPGTYDIGGGKQLAAFKEGTIYFRHGAKSEPGDTNDLTLVIEKEVDRRRRSWLKNIRKVVQAPADYGVNLMPTESNVGHPKGSQVTTAVRYTDDPSAPAWRYQTADDEHPLRQKDVVRLFNERLGDKKTIVRYDVQCVSKVHGINEEKPQFYYRPKYSVPTYSYEFVDWLIDSFNKDNEFFNKARAQCGEKQFAAG